MKIAVLSTIVPNGLRTGSEIATYAMLEVLRALGHEVTLYGYGREFFAVAAPVPSVLLATIPITTAETPAIDKARWVARSLRSGLPISSEKFNAVSPVRLAGEIERSGADLLLVDHVNLYPFVRGLAARLPTGVVFHDVQAVSYAMVARGARRPWWRWVYAREARLNEALEREAGAAARFAWFLSEADATVARDRLGIARATVVPLFYPLEAGPLPAAPKTHDIGLIGTWSWPPVGQGLRWFLDAVMPHLPPRVTIAVAGSGSEAVRSDRVTGLGPVPDARAFLASCRVSAVPTVAGTGIQIKTLELAATGMPAVSTPLGVRGLDALPASLRVAEEPAAFAAELVALIEAERCGRAAAVEGAGWNAVRRRAATEAIVASLRTVSGEAEPVRQPG